MTTGMKRWGWAAAAAAWGIQAGGAAWGAVAGAGTASGTAVHLGGTARVLAMGGAGIADVVEPGAIWINPAELARQHGPASVFMHGTYLQGVSLEQFSVSGPTPVGMLGGAVSLLRAGEIAGLDASGADTESISPSDTLTSVAWASSKDQFTFGAAASYLRSELASDVRATAVTVDAGGSAQVMPQLALSAAVQHLGGKLDYDRTAARVPSMLRAGAAYEIPAYRITVVLDAVKPQDGALGIRGGAEERFAVREDLALALRAGYHTDGPRGGATGAAAGLGVDWHPAGGFGGEVRSAAPGDKAYLVHAVRVEYAWTPLGELGAANWFSLSLIF